MRRLLAFVVLVSFLTACTPTKDAPPVPSSHAPIASPEQPTGPMVDLLKSFSHCDWVTPSTLVGWLAPIAHKSLAGGTAHFTPASRPSAESIARYQCTYRATVNGVADEAVFTISVMTDTRTIATRTTGRPDLVTAPIPANARRAFFGATTELVLYRRALLEVGIDTGDASLFDQEGAPAVPATRAVLQRVIATVGPKLAAV